MSLEIGWTEEAEFTFDNTVSLIKDNWGELSSDKFILKTWRILNSISRNPYMFPESGIENTRKAVIPNNRPSFTKFIPIK